MIIAFSGKARSGKTTGRELMRKMAYAQGYMFCAMSFAEPIRNLAKELFGWDGDKQLYELPDGSMDITKGRGLLITVGAKMREILPSVWVDFVIRQIEHGPNGVYVIDDLRFKNEADALRKTFPDALLIRVQSDKQAAIDDPTETDLDNYDGWTGTIDNNGDFIEYASKIQSVIKGVNDALTEK